MRPIRNSLFSGSGKIPTAKEIEDPGAPLERVSTIFLRG
jgi:hypothetical protein